MGAVRLMQHVFGCKGLAVAILKMRTCSDHCSDSLRLSIDDGLLHI